MIKGENNSVLQQQCIQTKNRLARPLSLVVMMAVLLCALFTVAALPVEPREVLLKKPTGASFAGVKNASVLDMGVVAPLNDIVWLDKEHYAAVSQDEEDYIWIYYCSVKEKTAEERAILTLEPGERYLSATALDDGTMAVVTTGRVFYLDRHLMEKRSVILPKKMFDEGMKEGVLSETGKSAAYVTEKGLYLYNIGTGETKLLLASNKYGSGSAPFMVSFQTPSTLSFRYSSADSSMRLCKASIDTGEVTYYENTGLYAGAYDGTVCYVREDNASRLVVTDERQGKELRFLFEDRVVSGLALMKQSALVQTFEPQTGVTYFEVLDFKKEEAAVVCSIDPQDGTTGRVLRVSSSGMLAVEFYTGEQSNTQILQLSLL